MSENLLTETVDPAQIPEKFKDPQSGAIRMETLLNSYTELERKMSGQIKAPKAPDEYCIECQHGMFEPDREVNERLHAKGLTNEQVQEVYDLAAEKLVPMIVELAGEFQADRELEKLISHFGGQEKWGQVSKQILAFGRKNLPADVLENLSGSYEGVLALYRMMKGEEPVLASKDAQPQIGMQEKELKSMMRDPKYWKEKDPAFVAKVTEGFKAMYGDE